MSYAYLLPPICDPVDGHLLMDGCYVNNVPGDVMLRSSCSHIIVVDVTAPDDTDLTNYGDQLRLVIRLISLSNGLLRLQYFAGISISIEIWDGWVAGWGPEYPT